MSGAFPIDHLHSAHHCGTDKVTGDAFQEVGIDSARVVRKPEPLNIVAERCRSSVASVRDAARADDGADVQGISERFNQCIQVRGVRMVVVRNSHRARQM